jgi:hypothetical protein
MELMIEGGTTLFRHPKNVSNTQFYTYLRICILGALGSEQTHLRGSKILTHVQMRVCYVTVKYSLPVRKAHGRSLSIDSLVITIA